MSGESIHYDQMVQYQEALDPFTDAAIRTFAPTVENAGPTGVRLLAQSVGETAQVYEIDGAPFYIAKNVEILGTKVDVAVSMARKDPGNRGRYFLGIGQDTANMSLNDLVGVGAQPFSYSPIIALGDNEMIKDSEIVDALLQGYLQAANDARAVIAGGETGTVMGVVQPGQADLAGGSVGIITPKERFCHGKRVEAGLVLYGLATHSPHANGFTAIRRIGESLPQGYFTQMPSGQTFGEAVLAPTPSYSPIVNGLLGEGIDVRYLQPITGHGFWKMARSKADLTYRITHLPEMPEVFTFIQERAKIGDKEMVTTYNCGVGFVVYAPADQEDGLMRVAQTLGVKVFRMGQVEEGPRRVVVEQLDVTLP